MLAKEASARRMESFSVEVAETSQQQVHHTGKRQFLRYFAIYSCIGFTIFIAGCCILWPLVAGGNKSASTSTTTLTDGNTSNDIDVSDDIPECRDTSPNVTLLERNSLCQDIGLFSNPRSKITIASGFMLRYTELDFVWQNHLQYAKKHSLNYFAPVCNSAFQYGEFRRVSGWWLKLSVVKFLLDKGSDYVFWIDGDSIFTGMEHNLDRLLVSPPKDIVFSGDLNVVFNDGHFMLRNTPWSQRMLSEVYRICLAPNWHDNGAFLVYLGGGVPYDRSTWQAGFDKTHHSCISHADAARMQSTLPAEIQKHVQVLAQDEMNSYDRNAAPYIIHFAGLSFEDKKKGLREMAPVGELVSPVPRYVYVDEKVDKKVETSLLT